MLSAFPSTQLQLYKFKEKKLWYSWFVYTVSACSIGRRRATNSLVCFYSWKDNKINAIRVVRRECRAIITREACKACVSRSKTKTLINTSKKNKKRKLLYHGKHQTDKHNKHSFVISIYNSHTPVHHYCTSWECCEENVVNTPTTETCLRLDLVYNFGWDIMYPEITPATTFKSVFHWTEITDTGFLAVLLLE